MIHGVLADLVVVLHLTYVCFVVVGFVLILIGIIRHWGWVRNFYFRAAHLLAIAIVSVEGLAGIVCPLTTLENWLRRKSGRQSYSGDFVGRCLHELIFVELSPALLTLAYLGFGAAVLLTFWAAPPRWPSWRASR